MATQAQHPPHSQPTSLTINGNAGDVPLLMRGVSYRYPGAEQDAVHGVDVQVLRGSCIGILGPNGGGKTTLVRLAMGLLEPTAGQVTVLGMPASQARQQRMIGYVSQKRPPVDGFPVDVRGFVELGLTATVGGFRSTSRAHKDAVKWALSVTGADAFADRPVSRLSGGQLQRAMIARGIAPRPPLLLLDEPTVGIDVAGQAAFAKLLETIGRETDAGVVVVSHDLRAVVAGCDGILCLSRTLHAHVSPEGLTPQVLGEIFAHEIEGVLGEVHVDAHLAAQCDHQHPDHAGHTHPTGAANCAHNDGDSPHRG